MIRASNHLLLKSHEFWQEPDHIPWVSPSAFQGTPRNPISTSDCPIGSDKYGASRKSTPGPEEWLRPRCEWRNVPWILNCCDSLVYCKLLDMWCEAIHWFNFNLMWCNGCTLDVMYACNRINFDVTNVWLSKYTSQWQQKTPNITCDSNYIV